MKTTMMKVSEILPNENNPRVIRNEKLKSLIKSIEEFPEMLELRTIVINKDNVAIGGNMRLAACQVLGIKEVPVIKVDLTPEQEKQFIIKDNVNYGEWDWEQLANEWDSPMLNSWGMDIWIADHDEEFAPKIEPRRAVDPINEGDLEKASEKLGNEMRKGTEKQFIKCTCPDCDTQFNVEK